MADHVILTRFNLPSKGAESYVRAKEGWLTERVALFERYCLPSVLAQTDERTRWLIYFDPESPQWLKDKIASHGDAYTPVYRPEVSREELRSDIRSLYGQVGDELITTNLDNDDGLAVDFVERLCAAPRPTTTAAYYLVNGLIKSPGGLYHRVDRHNAFVSVRESWDEPVTCWAHWHNHMHLHFPVVELDGAPVVAAGRARRQRVEPHTRRLVSPEPYKASFGDSLDDVAAPARCRGAGPVGGSAGPVHARLRARGREERGHEGPRQGWLREDQTEAGCSRLMP